MSLRTRLAIVAAGTVAAAVALASLAIYFIVRHELYGPVNKGLVQAVSEIRLPRFAALSAGPRPHEFVFSRFAFGPVGGFLPYRVITSDGRYVVPDLDTPLAALPVTSTERAVASGTAHAYFFDTKLDGQSARIYTQQVVSGYAVQVAGNIAPQNHALSKIRLWLIIVAFIGIALASAAGFFIARGALRPVRRLSETAEHVRATGDLTRRIDVKGTDEVSQLATTFNAMLGSLDAAMQRQRQLVQDASHELRTPLTSLRTNIEVLASGKRLPPEEREQLLEDVIAQLGEMTALIAELTELARGEEHAQALEEVRLDLIAEEAIRRTARNHPDVPIEADLAQTTVVGAPATLERAIANLLDNAAKWSPPGGRIQVHLYDGELTVRDHGPGIDEADLPHIFERFYRATSARSQPGSGLGLAIVKQVAEAHGGAVTAERARDGGTIMRLKVSRNGSTPGA